MYRVQSNDCLARKMEEMKTCKRNFITESYIPSLQCDGIYKVQETCLCLWQCRVHFSLCSVGLLGKGSLDSTLLC